MFTTYYVPGTVLNIHFRYSATSTRDREPFIGWHRHSKVNSVRKSSSITWKSKLQIDIPALP